MDKKIKSIGIAATVLSAIALAWSFAGSIIMFLDEYRVQSGVYYKYYSWHYKYTYYDNPAAGVMPFIGFLLILAALILIAVSLKGNRKIAIGTCVLAYLAQSMLYSSIALAEIWITFACCLLAGILMFIVSVLAIVYVAKKPQPEQPPQLQTDPRQGYVPQNTYAATNTTSYAAYAPRAVAPSTSNDSLDLIKLKELHDMGALSDVEYLALKAQALSKL